MAIELRNLVTWIHSLRSLLTPFRFGRSRRRLADELDEIALRCSQLPVLDPRTPDEILGYDELT
jgi:hypothetical protein